jgi:amidophosphoribosyltransferase
VLKNALPHFDGGFHVSGITGNGIGFVFRDAHGIRPSYYYITEDVVVAASERAAIRTAFNVGENEVRELMPGQALIVLENGEVKIEQVLEPKERKGLQLRTNLFFKGQ